MRGFNADMGQKDFFEIGSIHSDESGGIAKNNAP